MPDELPNWNAPAELHMLAKMQTENRIAPKYLESGTLEALIKKVMAKERPADRQIYSITVGKTVYDAPGIKRLYDRPDFPTEA